MIPFAPENYGRHVEEWFYLEYMQEVCRLKRPVEYERPVRLTGGEFVATKVPGYERKQMRFFLIFDFGPLEKYGWAVNIADIVSLTPVAEEARQ